MRLVIAAGGTGGHLYPAVALAQEFRRQDPEAAVLFVGTTRGIEGKVLAHEGYPLETISAQPVMGGGVRKLLAGVGGLPLAVRQSVGILKRWRAELVIGIGGYTSPPVVLAAWLLGIPRAVMEPNAVPGVANRAMGPVAQRVFLAFAAAAPFFLREKVRISGTPIRRAFLEDLGGSPTDLHAEGRSLLKGDGTLLVFGGSQGARALNQAMVDALPELRAWRPGLFIIHQTGEGEHERIVKAYEEAAGPAQVVPFLYDMPTVLRSADLVVSRAGAVTVAELTACGKPAILVPLPQAIHQHQLRNAQVLHEAGAAILVSQSDLSGRVLTDTIRRVLDDENKLRDMGDRSRALGRVDAAEQIVRECRILLRSRG